MQIIKNKTFDHERALYGSDGIHALNCRFDGPEDGESAFKESGNIKVENCFFNLRYPFWHDTNVEITNCEMTSLCRAALWYSENIKITNSKLLGIKALRECSNAEIYGCNIVSPEFGWFSKNVTMKNCNAESEYFMMHSEKLSFENVSLSGKYSFQYITDSNFDRCKFNTKDAFWHAKNIVIKDSIINGEYPAWYCENVTFENCIITGTQPFCYCKGLKLINCQMNNADLCFEKSEVSADITTHVISIKNPDFAIITLPSVDQLIECDKENCKITLG
ncbi:MAG: DUF3737 family protein [Clostridia bacterium]|nr:DUF3737 family protein [Clostridia bacterium]